MGCFNLLTKRKDYAKSSFDRLTKLVVSFIYRPFNKYSFAKVDSCKATFSLICTVSADGARTWLFSKSKVGLYDKNGRPLTYIKRN